MSIFQTEFAKTFSIHKPQEVHFKDGRKEPQGKLPVASHHVGRTGGGNELSAVMNVAVRFNEGFNVYSTHWNCGF